MVVVPELEVELELEDPLLFLGRPPLLPLEGDPSFSLLELELDGGLEGGSPPVAVLGACLVVDAAAAVGAAGGTMTGEGVPVILFGHAFSVSKLGLLPGPLL